MSASPEGARPPVARPHAPTQHSQHATPDKDAIALLPAFERLGLERITLVSTGAGAREAAAALAVTPACEC